MDDVSVRCEVCGKTFPLDKEAGLDDPTPCPGCGNEDGTKLWIDVEG